MLKKKLSVVRIGRGGVGGRLVISSNKKRFNIERSYSSHLKNRRYLFLSKYFPACLFLICIDILKHTLFFYIVRETLPF